MDTSARLLITCPDRVGIVATVTSFLYNHNANITTLDQHATRAEGGQFFMRVEFQTPNLDVGREGFERAFANVVGAPFGMDWRIRHASERPRVAILVSKPDHALLELLWRWRRGELDAEVVLVASNHPDHAAAVAEFGVPYHHVPVTRGAKEASEAELLRLLEGQVDLVVLARYMQILSAGFLDRCALHVINIHHSFLPAFAGASPYRQAWERGVKLIGATAHYVTAELDGGPIIDQDVVRVSHRHSATDMRDLGRDIERQVLARAVRWHLEDRVIVHGDKTVVFT